MESSNKGSQPFLFRTIALFFSLSIVLFMIFGCKKEAPPAPPPPAVEVLKVVQMDVPIYKEWVGALDGYVNAVIRPQVQGYLIKQNYREGELVKKGQILFEIDPRTFQADLDAAKAQLAQQKARHDTAQANLDRIRPLAAQNAVSQKDLDDAVGAELSTRASVEAAQAAVENAQLNLGFTKITSPVDGIAGIAKAQIGNLVGPGATEELTTVSTVNPIKVYVQASEQEYMKAVGKNQQAALKSLELILADGSMYPHKGEFAYADRQVDVQTGTIRVAALFPNPGNLLRPGQFAKIRAVMETKKGALLIPQRAVSEIQGRYMVAVIGPENKADIRTVQIGEQIGSDRIISEGLKPGEKVVAEGIQKVKQDQPVNPKPFEPQKPAATSGDSGKTEAKPSPAPSEKR